MLDPSRLRNVPPWWFTPVTPGGSEPSLIADERANLTRAVSDTLPPAQGGDSWLTGMPRPTPPEPPEPTPPWELTYSFNGMQVTFANDPTGRIPLTSWTGWDPAFAQDLNDEALYLGPDAPTSPAQQRVRLFATFVLQPEVEVEFDAFTLGTSAPNHITIWGFASAQTPSPPFPAVDSIYIQGANSTGQPIQLRLVKA